jgi:hypothetical protein
LKCKEVIANYLARYQTCYAFCTNQGGYRNADVQTVHRHRLFGRRDGDSEPKGVAHLLGEGDASSIEVPPPASPRKYWTRRGIVPTLVGIDHGFSFPIRQFDEHGLKHDWPTFLDDFQRHWPTDEDNTSVESLRSGVTRKGDARWRRLTETRAGGAKSVFLFDVQVSVAKSTHAGIPWLRYIRERLGTRVHFWPFDGWDIPAGRSAIVEVYPTLWSRSFGHEGRTGDQHDAFTIAASTSHDPVPSPRP